MEQKLAKHLAELDGALVAIRTLQKQFAEATKNIEELRAKDDLLEELHVEVRHGLIQVRAEFDQLSKSMRKSIDELIQVLKDQADRD